MVTAHHLPAMRCLTPNFDNASTPGLIFLNRKSSFRPSGKEFFHYKLDSLDPNGGYKSLPSRRSTVNVTFNQAAKNNFDPYVHASNWLPRFKDISKGFLARHKAEDLKKKHEAARIIQRTATSLLDPWLQIFQAIRPTFKVVKTDELKKYLRECIVQIKKLNSERQFVETQLCDIEDILEQSYHINEQAGLSVEGRRSPNIFARLTEVQENANNDTFLKECLDLDIDGVTNVEVRFDPSGFQNSKVHSVYELADKLQQKVNEDRHRWMNLAEKCEHLEKDTHDLRNTNKTLDTTTRMLRGMINKNEIDLKEQRDKVQEYLSILERINEDKRNLLNKIKEHENDIKDRDTELVERTAKCEYLEEEIDNKTKNIEILNQEKTRSDKKIKELEEKLTCDLENQNELESTIEIQKARLADLKKRFTEQLKSTEEDLMEVINDLKEELKTQSESFECQSETMKQHEMTIRMLEHEIEETRHKYASDEEIDYDKERQLSQQLKTAKADLETMREEMKIMEANGDEFQRRIIQLQINLDAANEDSVEQRKQIERLKAQMQSTKSALNDEELKLNRANREKNFNHQKWSQAKDKCTALELELVTVKEELANSTQTVSTKTREVDALTTELMETKKSFNDKINTTENTIIELNDKLDKHVLASAQRTEEWKRSNQIYENRIEMLQQFLEEKEMEIEQHELDKLDNQKYVKKLQRRIEEQEEVQSDSQKTITKLKDEIKSLQEENESQWNLSCRATPTEQRDRGLSRSSTAITSPSYTQNEGFLTLPGRRSTRQQ